MFSHWWGLYFKTIYSEQSFKCLSLKSHLKKVIILTKIFVDLKKLHSELNGEIQKKDFLGSKTICHRGITTKLWLVRHVGVNI